MILTVLFRHYLIFLADLSKLKGFFADSYVSGVTKTEISASTGISARNLNRYLGYEEFAGIYIPETDFGTGVEGKKAEGKVSL